MIDRHNEQTISNKLTSTDDVLTLKAQKGAAEFIPGQKSVGNETRIFFHSQVSEAGLYDLLQGSIKLTTLAFNYGNEESALSYFSRDDLEKMFDDNESVTVLNGATRTLTTQISEQTNGRQLWRYFIYIALAAILCEIFVLRFWGIKIKDNTTK